MVEKALDAGAVVPHWHEAATVEVLAVAYRRIVELVAATWLRAEGPAGEPSFDSRLTADCLLSAHPCNQLRSFH
ncbi:hypothetical protein GCM10010294_51390 [Streptomyces griseoloalbus]|nr:hypothetical protein GCM10010294_51390 [Streptomyces griseoloalbus]